jgi:hypothetical protein
VTDLEVPAVRRHRRQLLPGVEHHVALAVVLDGIADDGAPVGAAGLGPGGLGVLAVDALQVAQGVGIRSPRVILP